MEKYLKDKIYDVIRYAAPAPDPDPGSLQHMIKILSNNDIVFML